MLIALFDASAGSKYLTERAVQLFSRIDSAPLIIYPSMLANIKQNYFDGCRYSNNRILSRVTSLPAALHEIECIRRFLKPPQIQP